MAEMHQAELRPFDLEAAAAEKYDPTRFQPVLFCADSFQSMSDALREFLARW
jgi:phenylalanine-4-hydroxylase